MNLYSRLAFLASYQPAKSAVETAKQKLTYSELDTLARRIATRLRHAGVVEGDVVGLRMRETPDHIAAHFAVMRIGATILPIDWRGTRAELDRVAEQFGPKVVLDDDEPAPDRSPLAIDLAGISEVEPDIGPMGYGIGRPIVLSLTSGTTGLPKAMVVTHEQIYARCTSRALEGLFVGSDRYLVTLPLAYTAGREHALNVLLVGATLVLFPTLFEPAELVDFVNRTGITGVSLSPNISRALLGARLKRPMGMPGLRVYVSTTGKLQPEERAEIRQHVSKNLFDYYGSTGTGPIAIIGMESEGIEPTAVGHPVIAMEVAVVDEDGMPLADGEVGRIRVRGPLVTQEMIGSVSDADEGFRDGWYYPGDLGSIGPGGLLHLHGRGADLIKRGGLMIHAQEVEQVLRRHPSISDAAVVGAPSDKLGQEVVAFIVTRSPVEAKDIVRHCRGELAGFKVPARIEFVEALPRNAAGKVVKSRLLEGL